MAFILSVFPLFFSLSFFFLIFFVLHQFPFIPQSCEKVGVFLFFEHKLICMQLWQKKISFVLLISIYLYFSLSRIRCFCSRRDCLTGQRGCACLNIGGQGQYLHRVSGAFCMVTSSVLERVIPFPRPDLWPLGVPACFSLTNLPVGLQDKRNGQINNMLIELIMLQRAI